jgi:hypothetical protein
MSLKILIRRSFRSITDRVVVLIAKIIANVKFALGSISSGWKISLYGQENHLSRGEVRDLSL